MAQPPDRGPDVHALDHAHRIPTGKESPCPASRILLDRPRRTLAALATVLAAAGLTVASGADFTATSANPLNTFTTGTLTISNSNADAARS